MKDHEILLYLMRLQPENERQRKAINAAERAFREITGEYELPESIEDFFNAYDKNDLIGKSSAELYQEYLDFCDDFDYIKLSQIALTKAVKNTFSLIVKVAKVNGKSVRVFA